MLNRGVKKSDGSTIIFSLGLIFMFSMIMLAVVAWINIQHEKVKKECREFYGRDYVIQVGEVNLETD